MPEENRVNIPLLRKAVEWAEAEAAKPPELREWEQSAYVLPSPADRPNFAATRWIVPDSARSWAEFEWSARNKAPNCGTCFCIAGYIAHQVTGNLDYSRAEEIALEALGIESDETDGYESLFCSTNTIEDVRRIAETIAGERL